MTGTNAIKWGLRVKSCAGHTFDKTATESQCSLLGMTGRILVRDTATNGVLVVECPLPASLHVQRCLHNPVQSVTHSTQDTHSVNAAQVHRQIYAQSGAHSLAISHDAICASSAGHRVKFLAAMSTDNCAMLAPVCPRHGTQHMSAQSNALADFAVSMLLLLQ